MPNFRYRIAKTVFKTIEDGWCCHGTKSLNGWGTRACGPQALPLHTQQWSQTTAAAQYTVVARFVSGHRVERRDPSCHCCRSICSASGGGGRGERNLRPGKLCPTSRRKGEKTQGQNMTAGTKNLKHIWKACSSFRSATSTPFSIFTHKQHLYTHGVVIPSASFSLC